jgi:hypothetical protein
MGVIIFGLALLTLLAFFLWLLLSRAMWSALG